MPSAVPRQRPKYDIDYLAMCALKFELGHAARCAKAASQV
jgi:hypothetical protein